MEHPGDSKPYIPLTREDELKHLEALNKHIKNLEKELQQYKKSFPTCDEHKPSGGVRSSCLVCECIRLNAVISNIDYLLGPPNEMECSLYAIDCDDERVVNKVKELMSFLKGKS